MGGSTDRGVRGWFHRLTRDDHQLQADSLVDDIDDAGATRASQCRTGQQVHLQGTLRMVSVQPRQSTRTLVAELYDGTGSIELVWLGRRTIPGITAGRAIRAAGRITLRDGVKAIYNPRYDLLPADQ